MYKIFISGSINIKKINKQVLERINNIIDSQYDIIVGDANGIDSSIQVYLQERKVKSVIVYCTGIAPRNNIGQWPINETKTTAKSGTRTYFTAKDIAMADDCDYGLMIWDTKSTGTLSNIIELLKRRKFSVVFINKVEVFLNIRKIEDLEKLISYMSESSLLKAETKIKLSKKMSELMSGQNKLF